jgi:tetratricopeptide (TPR) repeat protein
VRTCPFTMTRQPAPDTSFFKEQIAAAVGRFSIDEVLSRDVLGRTLDRALAEEPSADEALRAAVETARSRGIEAVAPRAYSNRTDLTGAMLRGAALLRREKLEEAAGAFRQALRISPEFLPAIVYLGACYAAGGRDREAVGAWQTALVTEADTPLMFRLAGDGLLRLGDTAQAASLLQEAIARWPTDQVIATRLALAVSVSEGTGRAIEMLQPALAQATAADGWLFSLADRLAAWSAARGEDHAPGVVAAVLAAAARAGSTPPPLAERWSRFFAERRPQG